MSSTLSGSGVKQTCGRCARTVQMIRVDGKLVACDAEVITIVESGRYGEAVSVAETTSGRRVHAELCEGYRMANEREQRRRELAAYNRRPPKRTKGAL